ncbi:uncharacterized protein FOMMEDRAFT_139182 [Fomitiporia mediterranea MF3/22]|uniref:uncharacterized protein n=1 Tax=Fomitiporia mediterranea (strain MF3/22) TaxID=694068 RepID=UPI0004408FE8|nr:uncharacterized protein FOMMEDRAFT_139182 [Fomitiporia mediterranea MF3/22]EJD05853.1 hypothetical protein FOMMEDRAFT_139182 [Fomitiporia mediterranea MF3/22]
MTVRTMRDTLKTADEAEIGEFLTLLDEEILQISASDGESSQRRDFEEELQSIYDEHVDFYRFQPVEIFLDVLAHARPILPVTTFIATWFDLLLRPALREPRLTSPAVERAKQLVIEALENDGEDPEMVTNFRKRLVDLYLLDALNESSGKDILEWAQLDEHQRNMNIWWKNNLEDILVTYGLAQPEELMDVMQDCFKTSSSRLQLISLLDSLVSQPSFLDISSAVFTHPLMGSIFRSLEVDNSSTVCAVELALLVKILPCAAIKAYGPLKDILPRLLGILGRVLCWKARGGQVKQGGCVTYSDLLDYDDPALIAEMEKKELDDEIEDLKETWQSKLEIREELEWDRLERTFDMSTTSLPVPKQFFSLLYFLFPCNTIHFLRRPIAYLEERDADSPWTVGWKDALDELQIRTAGSSLMRTHIMHPSVLLHDLDSELSDGDRWNTYDVSRVVGECMMLDAQTVGSAGHGDHALHYLGPSDKRSHGLGRSGDVTTTQTPTVRNAQLDEPPPRLRKISLHDLIATSAALKSGADINVSEKAPVWPSILFTPPPSTAPSRSSSVDPTMISEATSPTDELKIPTQISETIAGLQREVLLLRTELNFELWLKRENVKHITRLHQDGVLTKSAELEQQRLQNRLREYRGQLIELQKESKKQQEQAQSMKKNDIEWKENLSAKLNDLRQQKKSWMEEANALRTRNTDLETHLEAQGKRLDEAQKKVFELETEIKADALKVKRLRDYEKRIEQLTAMLRMWNNDIVQYNEQAKQMTELVSEHQKMKMRAEEYEKALADAEASAQSSRRRIQILEASLRSAELRAAPQRQNVEHMLAEQAKERDALAMNNKALREENEGLRDDIDELRAMVEVLKEKVSGSTGLISPTSPVFSSV